MALKGKDLGEAAWGQTVGCTGRGFSLRAVPRERFAGTRACPPRAWPQNSLAALSFSRSAPGVPPHSPRKPLKTCLYLRLCRHESQLNSNCHSEAFSVSSVSYDERCLYVSGLSSCLYGWGLHGMSWVPSTCECTSRGDTEGDRPLSRHLQPKEGTTVAHGASVYGRN